MDVLEQLGASLVITTYQANKLLVASAASRSRILPAVASVQCWNSQMALDEIFDVQLLGARFPVVMGFQQDTIQHTFVIPPQ